MPLGYQYCLVLLAQLVLSSTFPFASFTLWLIAKKLLGNGNRWPEIANLNGIKGTIIYAGQKLKIPD